MTADRLQRSVLALSVACAVKRTPLARSRPGGLLIALRELPHEYVVSPETAIDRRCALVEHERNRIGCSGRPLEAAAKGIGEGLT